MYTHTQYDSDRIKWDVFKAAAKLIVLYGGTTWTLKKTRWEKARWELHKNAKCYFEQILEAVARKTAAA